MARGLTRSPMHLPLNSLSPVRLSDNHGHSSAYGLADRTLVRLSSGVHDNAGWST